MDVQILCPCPLKGEEVRHPDGDTVRLKERLSFAEVTTIRKSMAVIDEDDPQVEFARRLATCTEFYLLMGIASWTLVDEKGKPLAASHSAIRELFERADVLAISDAAEQLYNPVVLLPLAMRASASSPPSLTPKPDSTDSTSQTLTPPSPLKRSRRSSISTTQTDGIETTSSSLGIVSSGSQSAA